MKYLKKTKVKSILFNLFIGLSKPSLKNRVLQDFSTVCSRSSYPFYIASYYIKRDTTSWTYSKQNQKKGKILDVYCMSKKIIPFYIITYYLKSPKLLGHKVELITMPPYPALQLLIHKQVFDNIVCPLDVHSQKIYIFCSF